MKLLTSAELAAELGVSITTVRRLIAAGMPALRLGRIYRFRLEQVLAWLERRGRRKR